jgi:4-hydroxymandelate oxidase
MSEMRLPPLAAIPPEIVAVEDYEALARERVEPSAWAYLEGGAADGLTVSENRTAFSRLKLLPRLLRELRGGHTQLELLGTTFSHPILIAPTAFHRLFHPDGEIATALGAAALEAGMTVSISATTSLEEIAAASNNPLWLQLYLQHDRGCMRDLILRAEAAGYRALVLTADAPLHGIRNRERRANFQLPPGIEAVNLRGFMPLPPANQVLGSELLESAPTWDDVTWLLENTRLPILLKGVLHPADARQAITQGISGVIVSNHGGRTLDTVVTAIDALPAVADAVAGKIPVLLDGGIRRGSDVFKALAFGADAVMIGRPILHGLAAAGAIGVAHVLKILRSELEMTMALCGCRHLPEISRDHVIRPSAS